MLSVSVGFLFPRLFPISKAEVNPESETVDSDPEFAPLTIWPSYLNSTLVENDTHYIYITTWGNYSFLKLEPYLMSYVYRDDTKLVDYSMFWINSSKVLLPMNQRVIVANDTFFEVKVEANLVTSENMGYMTVMFNFSREHPPKISVVFDKSKEWNLGDYNIVWGIISTHKFYKNEDKIEFCGKQHMEKFGDYTSVEVGQTDDPEKWYLRLVIDWSDVGINTCYLGKVEIASTLSSVGSLIAFPVNVHEIDPWTFGKSSSPFPTTYNHQRKTFFAHRFHFVFFTTGGKMVYYSKCDPRKQIVVGWKQQVLKNGQISGHQFSIWWDGTYVHYTLVFYTDTVSVLYYRRGTISTETPWRIDWESERTVSMADENTLFSIPYVAIDSNGYPWIGYTDSTFENGAWWDYPYVIKASAKDGSSWNEPVQLSTQQYYDVSVLPLTNGKVYVTYIKDGYPVKGRLWNGYSFEAEETVSTSAISRIYNRYSAVADGDDVHLVFGVKDTYDIKHVKRTYGVGWGSEVTIQSAQSDRSCPCIALGPAGSSTKLVVFWIHDDTVYMKKYVDGTWDETPSTPFGTNFTGASEGGFNLVCFYQAWDRRVGVVWRQGARAPYEVKYAHYVFRVKIGPYYWYYWNAGSDKAVVVLFGGYLSEQKPTGIYCVSLNDLYHPAEYSVEKKNFLEGLFVKGYSVLTSEHYPQIAYFGPETWLKDVATWLKNCSYHYIFLFGFSAGGTVVAYEIQKEYAATSYHASVIASAPVNSTEYNNPYGLFLSAQNASKAKLCSSFLEAKGDQYYYQMLLYHDNMVIHKEWHNWNNETDGVLDPHDVFKNTCADHPGETVLDAAYNWYQHRHPLGVFAKDQEDDNLSEGDVYLDGQWVGFTSSIFQVLGTHEVFINDFWEPGKTGNRYSFTHWEDGSVDNPRNITVTADTTVTARFYKKWCPGDVTGDGIVDIYDVVFVNQRLGSQRGDALWDSRADCVYDGVIDIYDVVEVTSHFGNEYPDP